MAVLPTSESAEETAHRSRETHNTTPTGYTPTKKRDRENLWIDRNPKHMR